jgi:Sortase family.
MADLANRIRTRIIPALLTALGVVFLAAGLMSLTSPVAADPLGTPSPSTGSAAAPTPSPLITLPPLGSGGLPSASPSIPADRVATRVRIRALKIDLPVIPPLDKGYPPCNVALFYQSPQLGQPGEGRATYLYAHARTGMFLPILTASKVSNGTKMKGMVAEVWTSDDQLFLYEITQVLRHVPYNKVFLKPFAAKGEELWLQTSEGVGTQPKLLLVGELLDQVAADHADANPVAKPLNCH